MRKEIHLYYSALGLNPGASAMEIRRAYLQLIQRWHPDHFKAGSYMHTTAEDLTKELNEAYEQLYKKQLYKKFLHRAGPKRPAPEPAASPADRARQAYRTGMRPDDKPGPVPPEQPRAERPASRQTPPVSPPPPVKPPVPPEPPKPKRRTPGRRFPAAAPVTPPAKPSSPPKTEKIRRFRNWPWNKAAVVIGLIVAGFTIRQTMPERYTGLTLPALLAAESRVANQPALFSTVATAGTAGQKQGTAAIVQKHSSPSPVIPRFASNVIQPVILPTSPVLQAADETSANTPRATDWARFLDDAKAQVDTFQLGDNKAKVVSIQGAPDDVGEAVFRYGSSLVYFKAGIVTGWSDGTPRLRVRTRAEMGFDLLNTFSVGSSRAEVFRAQGAPTDLTPKSYYYGASAIYFENDRVTSWTQVDQSLRTLVIPPMPPNDLDKFRGR